MGGYPGTRASDSGRSLRAMSSDPVGPSSSASPPMWVPPTLLWVVFLRNRFAFASPDFYWNWFDFFDWKMGGNQIFHSTHYSGEDLIMKFRYDEEWKKVYGPIFMYMNSLSNGEADPLEKLWEDAKKQVLSLTKWKLAFGFWIFIGFDWWIGILFYFLFFFRWRLKLRAGPMIFWNPMSFQNRIIEVTLAADY